MNIIRHRRLLGLLLLSLAVSHAESAENPQWVEGFAEVEFHHNANNAAASRDFRGPARGYMTAAWWSREQMQNNVLSWKTAVIPEKKATSFSFIGATCVLPSEIAVGPQAKLSVNGIHALTFTLGMNRAFTWKENGFELKYLSKRVEYPFYSAHRQLELHGCSGIYQLTVPESAVEAGTSAVLKVEVQPLPRWERGWFMVKARKDTLKDSMATLTGEIDSLRRDITSLGQQTQILAAKAYPEFAAAHDLQHDVLYNNGFRHAHPADLIKLQNGEVLMLWREAFDHFADDGDVMLLRSKDGGKTWGGKQVLAHVEHSDEREGCGLQLRDGTLMVGIFYNNLYNADGTYGKNHAEKLKMERMLGTYTLTSKDNGHTWSEPRYIDTAKMPFRSIEGPTDAPIEMPDGSVLMAVTAYNLGGRSGGVSSVLLRSVDQGKSWTHHSTIAESSSKFGGYMEPGILRTKSGRILVAMRNHHGENALWTSWSDDDGKTFSPVVKSPMIGHPADLMQLSDGRILCSYGLRPNVHATPGGIRACFSKDDGQTWDIENEVQLRNDFLNWDVGYPESLEMPDGRILTVYYYNLFGKYYLGGTSWKP